MGWGNVAFWTFYGKLQLLDVTVRMIILLIISYVEVQLKI